MYSDEDLDSAVAAGAISADAAAALRAHVARAHHSPAVDEEHFRLVTGFNDIFVVIAAALLLAAVVSIAGTIAPWLGALVGCATAWALAEVFVRRRRMALPGIVLLLAFVAGVFATCVLVFGNSSIALAGAVAAGAAWLHWLRFRVPITVAAGAAALVGGILFGLVALLPSALRWLSPATFLAGLAVFALALRWDASDTERVTRRSDVAFWLHLVAAPLMVHPVFTAIGVSADQGGIAQALLVVALYVAIALVSLAIDRRALMVSALGYVLYAFTTMLTQSGMVGLSFAVTALAVGSALLLLSAFWQPSRVLALGWLPTSVRARLPSLHARV